MLPIDESPSSPTNGSTSQRKIEANRENSLRSTGPRTLRGKSLSRRNTMTHGILASAALLSPEDRARFKKLLHALRRDLAPVGELEELLIEELADCYRKKRGARIWEAEIFQLRSVIDRELSRLKGAPETLKLDQLLRYEAAADRQIRFVLNQLERRRRARPAEAVPPANAPVVG